MWRKVDYPNPVQQPASLAALARYCSPTENEVLQWYRLAAAAYTPNQLAALGVSFNLQRLLASGKVQRGVARNVWLAYSYAYAPGNLASPYAYATWGRFNSENQDTAELLARRWADHNKKKKPQPWKRKRSPRPRPAGDIHPAAQQFFLPPL